MSDASADYRYFLTYSGVKLPLRLVNELNEEETQNRNTYFCAAFDDRERLVLCQKRVYGEIEMEHRYSYHDNGALSRAVITMAGDKRELQFDVEGAPIN